MSTAPGRIMGKPSVKALRKRLSGRVATIQIKPARPAQRRRDSFSRPRHAGYGAPASTRTRPDGAEADRSSPASDPGLLLLLRWRRDLRGGCCACRRIRERIGQELADNLGHLRRGYEIVVTVARHDRQSSSSAPASQAASDTAVNGQNGCHETLAHRHLNCRF
jgi:hypothetical protein